MLTSSLPSGRFTGWRPSPIDSRDYVTQVGEGVAIPVGSYPTEYEPDDTPPIDNQADLGACTANAAMRAIRYAFIQAGVDPGPLSRLWAYAQTRFLEGGWAQFAEDSGAFGHDDFKIARHIGLVLETIWPYADYATSFNDKEIFQKVKRSDYPQRYFIDNYSRPSADFDTFASVLSSKKIIIFGFPVYQSFESEATANSGIVTVPGRGERILGGHEIAFEGYVYKAGVRYWKAANNWNVTWGDNGYCYFPDNYMFKYGMSDYRVVDSVKTDMKEVN